MTIVTMHFFQDIKQNQEFGYQTIEIHCFASTNQTYTGTMIFGDESLTPFTGQGNLMQKNPALKTSDFCHGEHFL